MRSTLISTIALGTSASASVLVPPPDRHPLTSGACAFTLTAHGPGSASGIIGQLVDGQNRIGGGLPAGSYYLWMGPNPGFVDSKKRGCILTPGTKQWQCDEGVGPTPGFGINCDGTFHYHGNPGFYACPVNDHGEWNVYTQPVTGQKKCVPIKITASGNCALPCAQPVPPPPHKDTCDGKSKDKGKCVPGPAPHAPPVHLPPTSWNKTDCHGKKEGKCTPRPRPLPPSECHHKGDGKGKGQCGKPASCPVDLNGEYEFPHLIVPLDKYNRDTPGGNRFNGTITPQVCSAFNFDIHPDSAGKTCSLIFLLPLQQDLETSAYDFSGDGSLTFNRLLKPVERGTTWNNKGAWQHLSTKPVWPGSSTLAWTGPCKAGKKIAIEVCSKGIELEYFQDWNPSPIGLYVRQC